VLSRLATLASIGIGLVFKKAIGIGLVFKKATNGNVTVLATKYYNHSSIFYVIFFEPCRVLCL
jgi:hypothetical protein